MNKFYDNSFQAVYAWAIEDGTEIKLSTVTGPRGEMPAMRLGDPCNNVQAVFQLHDETPFCLTMLKPALLAIRGMPICCKCDSVVALLSDGWMCTKCGQHGENATPIRSTMPGAQKTAQELNQPYIRWKH